jgi:hypothetical protein
MKKMIYQVYTGKSSRLYDWCTDSVEAYAKRIGADYIQLNVPVLKIKPDPFVTNRSKESYEKYGGFLPIYEKENAFKYFDRYDQIAIIDADIYIRDTAPDIFKELKPETDFAGVYEREMPVTPQYGAKIRNYSHMQYGKFEKHFDFNHAYGAPFMNMGMMVMNNSFSKYLGGLSPKDWLMQPVFKDFIDGLGAWKWSTDQTLLNCFVRSKNMNVQHLGYEWNGLYTAIPDDKIKDCHFVHFFLKDKLPAAGENVEELKRICQI